MSNDRQPAERFGRYIDDAIRAAGFRSISAFARAAGLETSVVARWIRGETTPTAANLQKAATPLRMSEADLFAVAFPSDTSGPKPIPLIAVEVIRLLDPDGPLTPAERDRFETMLGYLVEHHRGKLRGT